MINSFHMNPLLYLLVIPICGAIYVLYTSIIGKPLETFVLYNIIILIILLLLLFYLYINNLIGLPDLIMLILIFLMINNPLAGTTMFLNIILIPLAIGLSLIFRK